MSLETKKLITDRIWQQSQAAGSIKIMLLALAEFADEDGFCFPAHETLGRMIGLRGNPKTIQRNVLHNLTKLTEAGEIICWRQQGRRGGRGYTNIYLISLGLTYEEITERIQRRFELQADEVGPAIAQDGEIYHRLCTDRRISEEALSRTNKGAKDDTIINKPPIDDTHNTQKGAKDSASDSQKTNKGAKDDTRTESFIKESNPSKESKLESPKQKMFRALAELCRIDLSVATEKQMGLLGQAGGALIKKVQDIDQFKAKFNVYWDEVDWRGKKGQAPTPPQIREVYGDFCHWLENPAAYQKNGATNNGIYLKPNQQRNTDPDRIPSWDPFADGWQPPPRVS